ncbi:hypothetical protein Tco_0773812 [Tanacetum coccineum]|uniref:Uncharacterized protein n=1 Tax=Tanacetum coccineum TaxID=301880 RepID=A0ABQ4ZN43_9ASTR
MISSEWEAHLGAVCTLLEAVCVYPFGIFAGSAVLCFKVLPLTSVDRKKALFGCCTVDHENKKIVYHVLRSNMLRAFSLFLLALAASEVFGADEDAGSVVAWSPLVIISHMIDEVEGIDSASDIFQSLERFQMIIILLDQSLYTGSDTTCWIVIPKRRQVAVWNDYRSCKVRISLNGNLLWEASVLLGRKKGCVMDTLKFTAMPFGLTNAPAVFKELMSQQRNRKLSRCGRNEMGNEPILAFPGRSRRFHSILRRAKQGFGSMLGKKEKVIVCMSQQLKVLMKDCMTNMMLFSEFNFEAKYHLGKANVDVVPWNRKKE